MASIEFQNPKDTANVHLYKLYPYILCFRQDYGPKKHSHDLNLGSGSKYEKFYREEYSALDFFEYIENNIDGILEELNLRWIISILECYADGHPSSEIKLQALSLVNLARIEHIHQSYMYSLNLDRVNFYKQYESISDNKVDICGGLCRYIGETEVHLNLMWRNLQLINHFALRKMFKFLHTEFRTKWYSSFTHESIYEIATKIDELKKDTKK
jgi:hypothetical protein